ncbi:hypothetical protein Pla123a_10890 [Posidoniimonas polymericola]|uniref:Uncharacterized protein n=1 Tax=Posidoniimonas polymericola TaxID=2528002 RepID=A0A5C5YTK8_9BACT|nr:hypothetical protein [Posidoniimonas polymericola]TWT78298.1 hypothetical protein Pla123a_10890 [Posidoniimonas polymericola]
MKFRTATASVLLICCTTGCLSVCNNAYRTLIKEPKQFSWRRDRCESRTLYAAWASDAWAEQRASGVECRSADFVLGFQEGFVEFCYAGGTGEPPPVPPRPYWNSLNRVAPLNKGAYEWFDGYRLGARIAREGGYRDQAVVPASASLCSKGGAIEGGAGCPCNTGGDDAIAPRAPYPGDLEPVPAMPIDATAPDALLLPMLDGSTSPLSPHAVSPAAFGRKNPSAVVVDAPRGEAAEPVGPSHEAVPNYSATAPSQRSLHRDVVPPSASRRFGNDFLR